jgi:hypothetical protein
MAHKVNREYSKAYPSGLTVSQDIADIVMGDSATSPDVQAWNTKDERNLATPLPLRKAAVESETTLKDHSGPAVLGSTKLSSQAT